MLLPTPPDARYQQAMVRLMADGLLELHGEHLHPSRRWQAAMARAARHLVERQESHEDIRLPIVHALLEIYARAADAMEDDALLTLTEVMLWAELEADGHSHASRH